MAESLSDATLLERFVCAREEAAFVELVRRHGPRVERICRRILRDQHDVEDVLQATFLVLARKAAGIPWHDSVSPWIDGVARRLALHARSGAARHRSRERAVTSLAGGSSDPDGRLPERLHPMVEPSAEVERRDLRRVLDDELQQLPEKYRAPVVLCDLEGHTREEAARQLGWPAGSMSRRLDRARFLLRRRLSYRGVSIAVVGLASLAVAVGLATGRGGPDSSVRPIMAAFRSNSGRGEGHGDVLAAAARGDQASPDFARILPAARAAASAARRIEGHRPDGSRSEWIWALLAVEMRESALDLERACVNSDPAALAAAARRLDASCVRCHTAFRRGAAPADIPGPSPVSSYLDLADPPDRGETSLFDPGRLRTAFRPEGAAAARQAPPGHPRPGAALRSPTFATSSGFDHLASNDGMLPAVQKVEADRKGLVPRSIPALAVRWSIVAGEPPPSDPRGRPGGTPA